MIPSAGAFTGFASRFPRGIPAHRTEVLSAERPRIFSSEALKSEASKLQQQLDSINTAIRALGGNSVSRGVGRDRKSQNSEGAKGAVGEGEGREEECLNNFLVTLWQE